MLLVPPGGIFKLLQTGFQALSMAYFMSNPQIKLLFPKNQSTSQKV